jgi:MFS transporter, CP family, cyanate transporter
MAIGRRGAASGVQPPPGRAPSLASAAVSVAGVVLVSLNLRMAVTGIPPVLDRLGLGAEAQSFLVTVPVLCFSAGALAAPRLRMYLGEEKAIFSVVLLLASGLLLRALSPEVGLFFGTVFAGLGIAVLNALLPSLVKRRFPNSVGAMMATYTTVMTFGASVAAGLTVPVLQGSGSISLALGIWAVPAGVALVAWLPQLRLAPAKDATSSTAVSPHGWSIWKKPLAWQVMLFMGFQSVSFYGPLSWIPAIYHEHGVGAATAGYLLLVMSIVSMITNVVAPAVAARMRAQRGVIALTVLITGAGALGLLIAPTAGAIGWMVLLGIGQGATISLALLVIVLRAADSDTAAALSSMAQSGGYLIAAVGPLAMGLLHALTGAWTVPLVFLLALIGAELVAGIAAGRPVVLGANDSLEASGN